MKGKLTLPKRKRLLLATGVICAVLVAGSLMWFTRQTVEAAVITPPSPPSGLVGWWKLDEGIGSIANDSSGNGNNGTVYSAAWTQGKFGSALSFNGIGSYVSIPDNAALSLPNNFSISLWFSSSQAPSGWADLIGKRGSTVNYGVYINPDGTLHFEIYDGTHDPDISTSRSVCDGSFHQVVAIRNGGVMNLYVDGTSVSNAADTTWGNTVTNTAPVTLGNGYKFFNGVIDEVQVYNRALSANEVQTDFQTGPYFSAQLTAKIPKGTTQVIVTLSWQGAGSINATITSPSLYYTEDNITGVYQKTTYSTTGANTAMLNIKRLSISVNPAPLSDQSWTIALTFDGVSAYQISAEVQK